MRGALGVSVDQAKAGRCEEETRCICTGGMRSEDREGRRYFNLPKNDWIEVECNLMGSGEKDILWIPINHPHFNPHIPQPPREPSQTISTHHKPQIDFTLDTSQQDRGTSHQFYLLPRRLAFSRDLCQRPGGVFNGVLLGYEG